MTRTRRSSIGLLAMALLWGVVAEGAGAAVVQVDLHSGDAGPGAAVSYFGAPGEVNWVSARVEVSASGPITRFVEGQAVILPGPGCHAESTPDQVACPTPPDAKTTGLSIYLGDHHDRFSLSAESGLEFSSVVFGRGGADEIYGAKRIFGGPGRDSLGAGATVGDTQGPLGVHVSGGPHSDVIYGGRRADFINAGKGADDVDAGAGDDHLIAENGDTDGSLRCGPGKDLAELDRYDLPIGCETVDRNGKPRALFLHPYFTDANPATVVVACPSDMPRRCATTVILSTVSGRPLARRRVSIDPGTTKSARLRHPGSVLDDAARARVTLLTERPNGPPLRYTRTLYFLADSE